MDHRIGIVRDLLSIYKKNSPAAALISSYTIQINFVFYCHKPGRRRLPIPVRYSPLL